jgi:branched-chain amino acid transport system permease protein
MLLLSGLPLLVLWNSPYWVNILAYTYLFAALAAAWNIIGGFGGQFSLGHGVFFAIGAYAVARLYLDLGLTPWVAIFPAAALATSSLADHGRRSVRGPFLPSPRWRSTGLLRSPATAIASGGRVGSWSVPRRRLQHDHLELEMRC